MADGRRPLRGRWRRSATGNLVLAALAGASLTLGLVLVDTLVMGRDGMLLIEAGATGPSAAAIQDDFPGRTLPPGTGHDGQQVYAVARAPMHLDEVSGDLDRPQYRLGRPLLPWLAWMLHPSGGGWGLVAAMVVAGAVAVALMAVAAGLLAASGGAPPLTALVAAILPGTYYSLRLGVADALATGLALLSVHLSLRERRGAAIGVAVVAGLAKESSLLIVAGFALWRRDRHGMALVAAPAAVLATWLAVVRLVVSDAGQAVSEIRPPFAGWLDALDTWRTGAEVGGALTLLSAVALGAIALWRTGLGSPVGWPIALQLLFLTVLSVHVVGPMANAARATLPMHVLALVALTAPHLSGRRSSPAGQLPRTDPAAPG